MANELSIGGLALSFAKTGSPSWSFAPATITPTIAGAQWVDNVQSIATSETTIVMGDATGAGWVFMQNQDATNYVEIKTAASGTIFAKLLAGEYCFFRFGSGVTAPVAIANTAACNLRVWHIDA